MSADVFRLEASGYDHDEIVRFLSRDCEAVFRVIRPGMRVVLKPNWVRQGNWQNEGAWQALVTHPAVLSAVLEVVADHLVNRGEILVCDGPQTDSSFSAILARYPVDRWMDQCRQRGLTLKVLDLRAQEWVSERGAVVARRPLPGDPLGQTEVNLRDEWSEFYGHRPGPGGYYGADYDIAETNRAHNGRDNLYRVSRSVMSADVFINLPKLKTHQKAGITANLKNLVGINTHKNFLPHYSLGSPAEGGDQFPQGGGLQRLEARGGRWLKQRVLRHPGLARLFAGIKPLLGQILGEEETLRSGSWSGNDTLWRMVLDLNKILLYADADGHLDPGLVRPGRTYIGVVDAIVAGQGQGPLNPEPFALGQLFCGTDPVVLDTVCARALGFEEKRIPAVDRAWSVRHLPLTPERQEAVRIHGPAGVMDLDAFSRTLTKVAKPPRGWEVLTRPDPQEGGR